MQSQNQIMYAPADRIASIQPYFFARLNKIIQGLQQNGMDVIRLDMGSPDLPPADFIIESLIKSVKNPDSHGYTPYGGTPSFKNAISVYYANRFGVKLDPVAEIVGLIGSKEGLFNFGQALANPGDYHLITDPGYPVYESSALISGGKIYYLPMTQSNRYMPDLDAVPADIASKTKILWMNYPNNPTGAIADEAFLQQAVNTAKKNGWIIAFDAPYTDVCFDGYRAPSILQFPGAMDVAVEFNSLSKTYNMAGWRVGMAVGNPDLLRHLSTYKTQADSSNLKGILDASVTALTGDQTWIIGRNDIYRERRDIVITYLNQSNFEVDVPKAGLYVWFKLPDKWSDDSQFCSSLLHETGVSMTPGSVYGPNGKSFVRISLGTATKRINEAMNRFAEWLKQKKE